MTDAARSDGTAVIATKSIEMIVQQRLAARSR
jgi:hypothetical protein